MSDDWYKPSEVIPTVSQLQFFVLPYLDDLRDGSWPPDTRDTGYFDNGRSSTRVTIAPWLGAAELAAEIDERMGRVVDSVALILHYTAGWEWYKVARNLHYTENELRREVILMLKYIAGRNRKRDTYPRWKARFIARKGYNISQKVLTS